MSWMWLVGAAFAQTVSTSGSCPGAVDVFVDGALADGDVALLGSADGGNAWVPGGPCVGAVTELGPDMAFIGPFRADGDGRVALRPSVGAPLTSLIVQAVDLGTCRVSPPVALCGDGADPRPFSTAATSVDLSVVFDTTCSMSGWLDFLTGAYPRAAATLEAEVASITFGFATYDDYNHSSFGSGSDKPFILHQQQTTDPLRLSRALGDAVIHSGADGPESGHEAIFQAATGNGYDQNCNGEYDDSDDVQPFVASPFDAFAGAVPGTWDPLVPDSGDIGGMGFRPGAMPILVLVTDNELRDPSAGYGSPGGCAFDATSDDAIAAASAIGARVVGVSVSEWNETGKAQMAAMAAGTGALLDVDGDGDTEPAVIDIDTEEALEDALVFAVRGLAGTGGLYDEVALVVSDDPTGSVAGVAPARYVDAAGRDPLPFTIIADGPVVDLPTPYPFEVTLLGDGAPIARIALYVDR